MSNNTSTITLTLTARQADVLDTAVELLSRVAMGQLAMELPQHLPGAPVVSYSGEIRDHLRAAESCLSPCGIKQASLAGRIAWDIHQVLRRANAIRRNGGALPPDASMYVTYDRPLRVSDEPLVTIEDVTR